MVRLVVLSLLLLAPTLAGCLSDGTSGDDADDDPAAAYPACVHPYPCGNEWPEGLEGPFEFSHSERLQVALETGVTLDGAIWWPDVPNGTDVPLVLMATPYAGQCRYSSVSGVAFDATEGDTSIPCSGPPFSSSTGGFLYDQIGPDGYAFAMFNVRGTGLSEGCYTFYGEESRKDLAALVDYLGAMDGINGRVAMWGVSAMGTTPFMAAVESPEALKTIIPSGIMTDVYLNRFTPQGAMEDDRAPFGAGWPTANSAVPPAGAYLDNGVDEWTGLAPTTARNAADRACPDVAENAVVSGQGQFTDDRTPAFWDERNMVPLLPQISAAVFVQMGMHDFGHGYHDDAIWPYINAPKRMLQGAWGHAMFFDDDLANYPYGNNTKTVVVDWLNFWLKGIGDPPRVGLVDIQDHEKAFWYEAAEWPPVVPQEALYVNDDSLTPAPGGAVSFQSVYADDGDPCGDAADRMDAIGGRVVLATEPVADDVHVLGAPFAALDIMSSEPGGIIALDLFHTGPGGLCDEPHWVTFGGADLRHLDGSGTGSDFPTAAETFVRIDLQATSYVIPAGDRLVAVLSGYGQQRYLGQAYAPTILVSGDSHIVVPVGEGTIGGALPDLEYPPRPRMPGLT